MEKRRFPIITKENGPEYSRETQVKLVFACTALHNFIVDNEGLDAAEASDYTMRVEGAAAENSSAPPSRSADAAARIINKRRDKIAEEMWIAYNIYKNLA